MPNKNTLFVGKVLHRFPVLSSTNDEAGQWLISDQPAEGAVIVADHQTAGRGQMGNTWETTPGQNLTLSVIFYPHFLIAGQQFDLNQAVALAVRDTIAHCTKKIVKIKWPNDILIGKRKVCGILIQNSLSGRNIQSSIVGIGINVNQRQFPPDLPHAGSLYLETGNLSDLNELMENLFGFLESWYLRLRQGNSREIRTAYQTHLFQYGEKQLYAYPNGQTFYGTITDIDPSGRLILETEKGMEVFGIKDVKHVL